MPMLTLSDFADKMNEIMPILMKEFAHMQPQEIYKGKVTLPQILVLQYLSTQDSVKMTDIANFMKVTTAAVTGIVDRLVKAGYVNRIFDQNDRRIIKIEINLKGQALMKKVAHERRRMVMRIFGKVTEKDRQDYLRVLMRIEKHIKKGVI
ncbi:MAG: MarR family transcriptional regulator [Candidatus Omnitrophica bacterium]|jgi:DNA-binding MarR family transcriptional regulator|nr:MarR family transcriptional regulator [Candidatus Omnitrophota bacterium]MDD3987335.1 MarR family transcriptional regulator [Candidatus Omnitrophota bacterium]MDD4981620.1 MarR family transcriptional regulator [Candidatus Omnitrophota bacterium]MDD5665073.1 MarR family transcriptional regulator [Candidatus Omnitrophota bacterium]